MLDQHRRRWADVVQMVYRCFVFAVVMKVIVILHCIRNRLQPQLNLLREQILACFLVSIRNYVS